MLQENYNWQLDHRGLHEWYINEVPASLALAKHTPSQLAQIEVKVVLETLEDNHPWQQKQNHQESVAHEDNRSLSGTSPHDQGNQERIPINIKDW